MHLPELQIGAQKLCIVEMQIQLHLHKNKLCMNRKKCKLLIWSSLCDGGKLETVIAKGGEQDQIL